MDTSLTQTVRELLGQTSHACMHTHNPRARGMHARTGMPTIFTEVYRIRNAHALSLSHGAAW